MAYRSTLRGSYAGIGSMLRSDMLKAHMAVRGERVMAAAIARDVVYRGPDDPHRGRYEASFSVHTTNHGGWKHDRAAAVIMNSAPEAVYVECGTVNMRAEHVLFNALLEGASD